MSYTICLPVVGHTVTEFLRNLETAQNQTTLVELRIDTIQGLNPSDLTTIASHVTKDAIISCRLAKSGGEFAGSEKDLITIYNQMLTVGFRHVEIELADLLRFSRPLKLEPKPTGKKGKLAKISEQDQPTPLVDLNKRHPNTLIIASYYDLQKTPAYRKLRKIQKQMQSYHCHVQKFATRCLTQDDANNLIRLLTSKKKGEKVIVDGFGKHAKILNVVGPIFGSYTTFADAEFSDHIGMKYRDLAQVQGILEHVRG